MYKRIATGMLSLGVLSGCLADEHEAPFAVYSTTGKMTENCGETGLLSGPEQLSLRIGVRLVGSSGFHWDHGDGLVMGVIDDSGSFAVSNYMRVDMREGDTEKASCLIERTTVVQGALVGLPDEEGTYRSLDAVLRHEYRTYDGGAGCSDLLEGPDRVADALPCTVSYDLDGERE